ncbi:MAG: hypothetical protein K2N14_01870 [Clostridia bacterium]|nr:hypothetical protein [Clostridia bacterium]
MATIREILDNAYSVYMNTCNREELARAEESLTALLADTELAKVCSPQNRENAQFLKIKIGLKILAHEYFCEGYENADFLTLKTFAVDAVKECSERGFKKTGEICGRVLDCAEALDKVMFDAVALKERICDSDGRCVAGNADECREVSSVLTDKIKAAGLTEIPKNIFSDGAFFPDVKTQAVRDLTDLRNQADKMVTVFIEEQAKDIMRTGAEDITEKLNSMHFDYYPVFGIEKLAKAIVLFTPFSEEAEIVAWSCANGAKIYRVQALALENIDKSGIQALFDQLALIGADCVIYGAPRFRAKNKNDFYRAVMRFARSGRRAYIVADDGTRTVYEEALAAAKGEYSALDISFLYLSMPDFAQTIEIMQGLKMLSDDGGDIEYVRKYLPFMGFAGFNEAVKAFIANADWKRIAAERSQDNFQTAQKYMLKLSRQALFIDGGWGNYHEDIVVNKAKTFDYDDIKLVNPVNVRKIMEGNFSLFQKCAMITVYCLLCGASVDDWKELPREVKEERLGEASKLVMRALGVPIVPVVQVLDKLDSKGAGGTCYDGGKRIVYKHGCIKDFDWTSKAVCHECFHAFQRYAIDEGWQDWYETELHVTSGRISQWNYNFGKYRNIDKDEDGYMIQIVESDARAFESDCLGNNPGSSNIMNLIDFD